mgnify:CR=1 FL=1
MVDFRFIDPEIPFFNGRHTRYSALYKMCDYVNQTENLLTNICLYPFQIFRWLIGLLPLISPMGNHSVQ